MGEATEPINIEPADVSAEDWDYVCKRWDNLRMRTLSNRLYQQERQRIMERREGLVKVASLVFGSVALSRVVKDQSVIDAGLAIIFAGNVSSLVFGWGSKARDAAKRAADWASIDKEIEKVGRHFNENTINLWYSRCNEIESNEPAPNHSLFEICSQRACDTLGLKAGAGGPKIDWRLFRFIP